MQIVVTNSLSEIDGEQWNALNADGNPFTSHEFLHGLELTGCVGGRTGWKPHYMVACDDDGNMLAALPMYEKHHSWGEYVFDWAWANAWQQYGLAYYPKLVVAVPFSPVTGHRILVRENADTKAVTTALVSTAVEHAREQQYSSIHFLFPTEAEADRLMQQGFMLREDIQFHWANDDYTDFSDFLATLSSRKRKKIARERRRVAEAGIVFRHVSGHELTHAHIDRMHRFYMETIIAHNSTPYLNQAFFHRLVDQLADHVVLVEALADDRVVAGALNIRHGRTLFGRYWGCTEEYHSLHFETCYYQAIDYCISNGLKYFEGGAQGEHKLSRGFMPVVTKSAHWLAEQTLTPAVRKFLDHEKEHVAHYRKILEQHSPYRRTD
jgi:predicted N-acyltransferase